MKNIRINAAARLTGLIVALTLFGLGSANVAAQRARDTARGGATDLIELNRPAKPAPAVSTYKPMACPACKDQVVQVRDTDSKGGARALVSGTPLTKSVSRHGCAGCGVDWKIVGEGRAKQSVAMHKCTSCGAVTLACCNTKTGSDVATKGMEKKFEIAPLK